MRRQRNVLKKNDKIKPQKKTSNEMEIKNVPDKEIKVMVTKMLTELERKMENTLRI